MKKAFTVFLFAVSYLNINSNVYAGGFQVNLQGQKQTGMAHCGVGYVSDASGIFFNPGTLCFATKTSLIAGGSFIFHETVYREPYPGNYTTTTQNTIGTPFTFYANVKTKPTSIVSIGLGVYTPFGSHLKYNDDWLGKYIVQEIDLKAFFIQPTVSFKITDRLGIGAGFIYSTGSVLLKKAVPVQDSIGNYGEAKLTGKANGYGYNIGLLYKANDKLTLGASYRSRVNMKVDNGNANFSVPSSLSEYFPSTSFTAELPLPSVISCGFGFQPDSDLLISVEFNYVGWEVYDTLSFDFKDNTEKLEDVHSARMYKNSSIFRVGMQYRLNKKLCIRFGEYFDFTPVQNGYLTPETPDANKLAFTLGVGYKIGNSLNLDASLLYNAAKERTDTNYETQFGGTWKSAAWVPGIAIEYLFK